MAIWNFLKKMQPPATENTLKHDDAIVAVNIPLSEISERLRKMELRQKETTLQLDEITNILQDDEADNRPLLDALTVLSVQIEDFYRFAARDTDSPLFEQARMMWNAAKTAVEAAEFEMIDDSSVPFDFKCHETESCECDESVPGGYVLRTLKCGYAYKGEVIKRAVVVVNKPGARS